MNGFINNAVTSPFFTSMLSRRGNTPAALDLSRRGRALVISDFHMGAGRRDDLGHNGELLIRLLNDYYLAGGWHLILNGDIEELHRFSLGDIQKQWPPLYRVFDAFAARPGSTPTTTASCASLCATSSNRWASPTSPAPAAPAGAGKHRERIALVYWFREGEGSKFVNRGGYVIEPLGKTPFRRTVLNQERLDYVKARIDLLAPDC